MRRTIQVAVLLLLCASAAPAEINIVDSLEWMAVDAPLVVCGKVTAVADTKGPPGHTYRDIAVAVDQVVKGTLQERALSVRLGIAGLRHVQRAEEWKAGGHRFLFFLRRGEENDGRQMVGRWTLRERRQAVVDLQEPEDVFKANMTFARTADEILRIVRTYAKWKPPVTPAGSENIFKPQSGYLRMKVNLGVEIHRKLYGGSACYINVPALARYRTWVLDMARTDFIDQRRLAADALRNYPGPETVALLMVLLEDPGEAKVYEGSQIDALTKISYPVRLAAYDALLALGERPEKPLFERDATPLERRRERDGCWTRALTEVLPTGWLVHSIEPAAEPAGWKRTGGGDGLALECRNPAVTVANPKMGPYHPRFTLYVMPHEWEGANRHFLGEAVKEGKHLPRQAPKEPAVRQPAHPASYLGQCGNRDHYFASVVGHSTWHDPHVAVTRYFGLTITEAPSP